MNRTQLIKILKVVIIATIILFAFEILFSIDYINNYIEKLVTNSNGIGIYIVLFILMFIQVCFIPIPGYVIITASLHAKIINPSNGIFEMLCSSSFWIYIVVVMLGYMLGAMTAYYIGRFFGRKAVVWAAGDDDNYESWCTAINSKGKKYYLLTILLPFFPDDILCIVAGSIKFPRLTFFIFNLFGRFLGLFTVLITLGFVQNLGNKDNYASIILWGLLLITLIILYFYNKNKLKREKE